MSPIIQFRESRDWKYPVRPAYEVYGKNKEAEKIDFPDDRIYLLYLMIKNHGTPSIMDKKYEAEGIEKE